MEWKQSHGLRIVASAVLSLTVTGCSDWKLGLLERDYPEYFQNSSLNKVMKYNVEYSWNTGIAIGSSRMDISHGELASRQDIEAARLLPGCYLRFSMRIDDADVRRIAVVHSIDGRPLVPARTSLKQRLLNDKVWTDLQKTSSSWKSDGAVTAGKADFIHSILYGLPMRACSSTKGAPDLKGLVQEQITIEISHGGVIENRKFVFTTYWHRANSTAWKALTGT